MKTLIVQDKPWEPESGDLFSRWSKYIKRPYNADVDDALVRNRPIITLGSLCENTWAALSRIGIETVDPLSDFAYTCPYTKNRFYHFVPEILLPTKAEIYRKDMDDPHEDYAFDSGWCRHMHLDMGSDEAGAPKFRRNTIQRAVGGPGYTSGTLSSDGHGSWELAFMEVLNDDENMDLAAGNVDLLLGWVYIWFNK